MTTREAAYAELLATAPRTDERRSAVRRWMNAVRAERQAPHGCSGCDATLRNPNHTLCAACAEDAGYGHRAR